MEIKGTYKFDNWESLEFKDPDLEVLIDTLGVQPTKMTISINIKLSITLENGRGANFIYQLTGIEIDNLSFDNDSLIEKVIKKLEDYKI